MSPPPVRQRPSNELGIASVGSTGIGSPPARLMASRYCSRATMARGVAVPESVTAMRGPIRLHGIRFSACGSGLAAQARAIDELDEHAVRSAWMQERHHPLDPAARRVIDELHALGRQPRERARKIIDDKAEVVQRRPAALCDEARDTRLCVGRLE